MTAATVTADREAQQIVMRYQGMAAWPSVALGFGVVAAFALVCTLGALRIIPLWAGLILTPIFYGGLIFVIFSMIFIIGAIVSASN